MDSIALRPRKATEIVDASIEVYRRNPVHFMLLTTLVHAPWLILQIVLLGNAQPTEKILTQVMITFGAFFSYFLMSAVVVQMASDLYLGQETDAFIAIRRVGWKLPAAFIGALIQGFLVGIGLVLFLLPAVYWSAIYFAAIPIIVLERKGIFAAFDRSSALSKGLKGHILATISLVFLIRMTVSFGALIIVGIVPNIITQRVLSTLVQIVVYPLVGISDALLYYDARIRREGFDIEMLAAATSGAKSEPAVV
jgi:hypothetical protein